MIVLLGGYALIIYLLSQQDDNTSFKVGGNVSSCPLPTQNLELNTKNRNKAIKSDWIQYGAGNVDEPADFWKKLAKFWNTTEKSAKGMRCSNCVAFDISPRMRDCMKVVSDKDGDFGYCWMHQFKCHSARTCRTWAKGGAITTNERSFEWQNKNK
jgi:hypothetical protein